MINANGEVGRYNQGGWVNEDGVFVPETQLDAGDGTQRTGMFLWALQILGHESLPKFKQAYVNNIKNIRGPLGTYRRAAVDKVPMWYTDFDRMSRDQATGLLVGLAVTGQTKEILRFIMGHALRLFLFTTNVRRNGTTRTNHGKPIGNGQTRNYTIKLPDLTGPDFWALEIRCLFYSIKGKSFVAKALACLLMIPIQVVLLTILDLDVLVSVIMFNRSKSDSNVVDNLALKVSFAREVAPSLLSAIAYHLINKPKLIDKLNRFFSNPGDPNIIAKVYTQLYKG